MDISFRRCANLLALTAMLALACVPTLGRWWTASAEAARLGMHSAHADMHPGANESIPASRTGMADCEYCPILAGTALPDLSGVLPEWTAAHGDRALRAIEDARSLAPAGGLGARGPPRRG